jgi:acyl carrier protein
MTNIEKYTNAFTASFNVSADAAVKLNYQDIDAWDSVGHMGLIAAIEEAFGIMMEADDIIDFSSFEKGKEILSTKYNIAF